MSKMLSRTLTLLLAAAVLCLTAGCQGGGTKTRIHNFVIDETIKGASQSYVADDPQAGRIFLTLATTVQWPEKLGDRDIDVLQDSILAAMYGRHAVPGRGVDRAISSFLAVPDDLGYDVSEFAAIDSVPDNPGDAIEMYLEVTGKVADLTRRYLTYQVGTTAYLGGAHPNTAMHPFTYDFATAQVLTADNMFLPGAQAQVLDVVRHTLAAQLGVGVDELDSAGIFADQLTHLGEPYIIGDTIVFHYNPYDIAPYAMGPVDVAVWASLLQPYLSDMLRTLIYAD